MRRFRQLVVNAVMSTDLGDKQLKELRNARWEKAFAKDDTKDDTSFSLISTSTQAWGDAEVVSDAKQLQTNRKATIVIEQ